MHFPVTADTQWWGACHDPYTMYIYSLGHFLTTKGALIDGDWGVSKNDQFSPKVTKNLLKNIKSDKN